MSPDPSAPTTDEPTEEQVQEVLERARMGDPDSLPELREVLDRYPEVWRHHGDLVAYAQQSWVDLIGGEDLPIKESLGRQLAAMKADLAGPDPSPLEVLLVERIVACWLQLSYADASSARASGLSIRLADFGLRRQDSAQRRYLMAIASLAMTRRLLASAATPGGRGVKAALPSTEREGVCEAGKVDRKPILRRSRRKGPETRKAKNKPAGEDLVMRLDPPVKDPASRKPGRSGKTKVASTT